MKKILFLTGFIVFMSVMSGCGQQGLTELESGTQTNAFPKKLYGVWRADKYNWAFKFEEDGSILRLEHLLAGKVKMEEGGTYLEGPDEGAFAVFVMGPCETKYDAKTRRLSVKTVLDNFHMRLPAGDLEGRQEDYFDGPVSKNGKVWTVNWRCYSWLDGASPPDPNLIEANPEKLIFTKLETSVVDKENEGDL